LDSDYLQSLFRKSSLWGNRVIFEERRDPVPVEAISGACLMIRRNVFVAVQHFSSQYFMYAEDTDLCYRVQKAGWKNYYVGEAVVVHHGGQSSNAQPVSRFASLMMKESSFKFLYVHRGAWYATMFRASMGLTALVRLTLMAVATLFPLSKDRTRSLYGALDKWIGIFRWAIGLESWVREFRGKNSAG
jgi:N-acetylglucosaminyl-diphospho-decaprenol L-rhamnosyltransferase